MKYDGSTEEAAPPSGLEHKLLTHVLWADGTLDKFDAGLERHLVRGGRSDHQQSSIAA